MLDAAVLKYTAGSMLVVKRNLALAEYPLSLCERWHINGVSRLICPLMDGMNYNCVDWCEEHTSLESRKSGVYSGRVAAR